MRCAGTIPGAGSRLQRASPMPEKMGRISPPRKREDPCALRAQGSSTPSALYRNVLLLLCRRLLRSLLALLRLLGVLLLRLGLCGLGCGLGGLLGANAERDQGKSSEGSGHRTGHSSSWVVRNACRHACATAGFSKRRASVLFATSQRIP